jgi:hypothetical protein
MTAPLIFLLRKPEDLNSLARGSGCLISVVTGKIPFLTASFAGGLIVNGETPATTRRG